MIALVNRLHEQCTYVTAKEYFAATMPNADVSKASDERDLARQLDEYICGKTECDKAWSALSGEKQKSLQNRIDCGIKQIEEHFPLLPDEHLDSYTPSYFIKGYEDIPSGTVCIQRDTNCASMCFAFVGAVLNKDKDSVEFVTTTHSESQAHSTSATKNALSSSDMRATLVRLGHGVTYQLGGPIAAAVFTTVFGTGVPNHFGQLYVDIERLLNRALEQQFIDNAQGRINGVILFVRGDHNPRKESGIVSFATLYNNLIPHYNTMFGVRGDLILPSRAEAGFPTYMMSSYQSILLAQELALLDPTVQEPRFSSYTAVIRSIVQSSREHTNNLLPKLSQSRENRFRVVRRTETFFTGPKTYVTPFYRWVDDATGETSPQEWRCTAGRKEDSQAERDCRAHMATAQAAAVVVMKEHLGIDEFLANMDFLRNNPLPTGTEPAQPILLEYSVHLQSLAWQPYVQSPRMAGTTGQSRRMEAIRIRMRNAPPNADIRYVAHVQGDGWQQEVGNDETAGTTGRSLRMEAIRIRLNNMPEHTVRYRVHMQGMGWGPWVRDNAVAGTTGQKRRVEAIEISIHRRMDS